MWPLVQSRWEVSTARRRQTLKKRREKRERESWIGPLVTCGACRAVFSGGDRGGLGCVSHIWNSSCTEREPRGAQEEEEEEEEEEVEEEEVFPSSSAALPPHGLQLFTAFHLLRFSFLCKLDWARRSVLDFGLTSYSQVSRVAALNDRLPPRYTASDFRFPCFKFSLFRINTRRRRRSAAGCARMAHESFLAQMSPVCFSSSVHWLVSLFLSLSL